MVISRIVGGLGNQMFQYAFGRALSLAREAEHALDLHDFGDYLLHNGFELSRLFDIKARDLSTREIREVIGWRGGGRIRRALTRRRYAWARGTQFIVEPHFHFWPPALAAPADCYVAGYWQSEKYFAPAEGMIRKDFMFRLPLSPENEAVRQRMESCEAVSVHVRRGDYVSNQQTFATHGVCTADYYAKAIAFVAARCTKPEFFFFSDDALWPREHLKTGFPQHYVTSNRGSDGYNDMRLMSHCRHHIIANSSFGWWGAWLNPSLDKIVVAPRRWFATDLPDTRDLIPAGWIRL